MAQQRHKNPGFFFFKKGAASQHSLLSRSPVSGRTAFLFSWHNIPRLKKGAGGMEVKIEESEQSKFQAKQNQTGIPFPYRPSRSDGEACLYSNTAVRGVPISWAWFSVPRRGRRMYAYATDEAI